MPFNAWLTDFFQWDARWYATIAQDGHGFLPQTYVFPPLYGWTLGRLTDVTFFIASFFTSRPSWVLLFYPVAAVFGVSMFAFANTIFVVLTERRWLLSLEPASFRTRLRLWIIALVNPVAYFAVAAYSDMFFYALLMVTLVLITWTSPRADRWLFPRVKPVANRLMRASLYLLLFLLPWVRLTGFATAVWLALKRKEVLATLLSLAAFLAYYAIRTGDPFFFLFVQRVFQMPEGNLFSGAVKAYLILVHVFTGDIFRGWDFFIYWINFGVFPIMTLIATLTFVVWLLRRREFEWASVIFAMTLISHNQAFWRSTVRYALPLFPLFYWMMIARHKETLPQRIVFGISIGVSLMLQIFYARLFHAGNWAF